MGKKNLLVPSPYYIPLYDLQVHRLLLLKLDKQISGTISRSKQGIGLGGCECSTHALLDADFHH